ncbi:MAG: GyrI-like domain-containing protein [Beduini sp.]|uniref:AraC family transcriptional regulator n=1 Tax=Beduini sp. TaxID=1922300 RepID=UPI00399059A2
MWMDKMNEAMMYIEDNLTGDIDLEKIAQITCTSSYNFQRMFSYMSSVSLSEYIRRRRMTLAAIDLQNSDEKIVDIALKYGYASPTAFNRAFQNVHGIAPSMAKNCELTLKAYQPLRFIVKIEGVEELEYRIVRKEAFRITGVSYPLDPDLEKNYEIVPKLWKDSGSNGTITRLASYIKAEPLGLLGVSASDKQNHWRFYIAVASDAEISDMDSYWLPKATWVVFSSEGTHESLQQLEKRIWTEWFPNSSYEYADGPIIEVYQDPDPKHSKLELWMMVKDK